jgi:hypothetical protein
MKNAKHISWNPRVSPHKIRKLYESHASGLIDEDLVEDVGITLYLRCQSILYVGDAQKGKVHCPECLNNNRDTIIQRGSSGKEFLIVCPVCGWEITWGDYFRSYQGKQLSIGGAGDYFREYIKAYENANTLLEKMIAIDRVIHEFHYNILHGESQPTRAACVNLIEGTLTEVVAFLDELSCPDTSPEELRTSRQKWRETLKSMYDCHPKPDQTE